MYRAKTPFSWVYLVQPEDSTTERRGWFNELCKTSLWIGMSVLVSIGMSQLT
ncbi:hypothetical protein [Pseudodesulfovibrio piezophilus]|uniref:Uncharacterized protein n=1 Tax=Pseudodesulfovibrio piezophilus (strain DSM 21447 / JCM 15486 / C1TLV30) TaxID=1322246 RepID=M1WTC0_PSEP2|nr:hypothetical protein [Pseudodesulfovibrio piezophilus]CCH49427.1 conserved protein of unknown function [Pseudodesulfovibrio piezophilus C1TLV30]